MPTAQTDVLAANFASSSHSRKSRKSRKTLLTQISGSDLTQKTGRPSILKNNVVAIRTSPLPRRPRSEVITSVEPPAFSTEENGSATGRALPSNSVAPTKPDVFVKPAVPAKLRDVSTKTVDVSASRTALRSPYIPRVRSRLYLNSIVEDNSEHQATSSSSYAAAVSKADTVKTSTTRALTSGFTCCASQSAEVSSPIALASRYTASGTPQAGPTQVQSPRVLTPATLAGNPSYQSLDGAVKSILAAILSTKFGFRKAQAEESRARG
ncbi:hypothetical protein C8J57DRAFT_1288577 [Mycena rebaudengoi]|nr:hypothetical protein C8J57DRAFT_1288577 [Mycena rebaudengoi]